MSGIQNISVNSSAAYASVGTQGQPSLRPFANLDLTEAQRTSLRSIFANAKKTGESAADVQKQIDSVLSTTQQQTLASDRASAGAAGAGPQTGASAPTPPPSLTNLNLSAAQSSSLSEVLANAKQTGESQADVQKQINAILTPAQQQLLAGDKKAAAPAAPASASSASANTSTSTSASTGAKNQAVAAQSVRLNALLQQVLSTNEPTIS